MAEAEKTDIALEEWGGDEASLLTRHTYVDNGNVTIDMTNTGLAHILSLYH